MGMSSEGKLHMTTWLPLYLAGLSHIAGLYSAYYWWESSRTTFKLSPGFTLDGEVAVSAAEVQTYLNRVGALNARAALGAAVAVVFITIAAVLNSWPG
jgi:hypothetical protein